MIGLLHAFGSALCWAGLDASRKALADRVDAVALVVALTLGQAPLFAAWWAIDGGALGDLAGYAPPGGGALILNVLANVCFVRAVQLSPLSATVPLLSLTPVFTALLGIPLLGEWPAAREWSGITVVVLGALALNASRQTRGAKDLLRAFLRERGSPLMAAVALFWSLTGPLDKLALDHAAIPVHALIQTAGVGILLAIYLAARRRLAGLRDLRGSLPLFGGAVALAGAALALQLFAFQAMLVALVETVKRAVGMIASVAFGRALFGEAVTAPKVVAVVLMVVGTALLTLP